MKLEKINEVIKASPAIQIQSKISLLQRRVWNILLANAYNELPDKDIHTVSVSELAAKLGFDSGNHNYLKEVLESLGDCKVEWNLLNKDNKEVWGFAVLLASADIKDGICTYGFAPHLRLKLYNPRIYTRLNLSLQNRFKSQYALVLWEICFDYYDTKREQGESPFIPLDVFRELMGVESDEYVPFKAFNRKVIKIAIEEINTLTEYHVEVEYKRIGRKIAELKFHIAKVKELPIQESLFPDIEDLTPVAVELVQAGIDRNVAMETADREWDCVNPEKLPDPGTYPDFIEYISEKIEMSLDAARVNNRAGYIIDAIRENYQNKRIQKAREKRAETARENELENLETEFNAKRNHIVREAVRARPELIEQAATCIENPFVRNRLNEYRSPTEAYEERSMVKSEIDAIIAEEFCQELLAPVVAAYEDEKARILG
ncbi:MAG: replication initiation protein [Candidatus Poribacteria bacterium]|nr:replication initiation protein [Candidatus Poribacteria bacterium]